MLGRKIEKRGNKWCTIHHRGPKKGTVIACFPTYKKALAQHKAIWAAKGKKKG